MNKRAFEDIWKRSLPEGGFASRPGGWATWPIRQAAWAPSGKKASDSGGKPSAR